VNLDFADVRSIMREMGKAMMGTGEAQGDKRAILAAEAAIANPLLDEVSMKGARGLLISITGGNDLTLYEVDEAASRIRQEVDEEANIILGATFDSSLDGIIRVSVVATGIDQPLAGREPAASEARIAEAAQRLRAQATPRIESPRYQQPVMTEAVKAEPAPAYAPEQAAPAYAPAANAPQAVTLTPATPVQAAPMAPAAAPQSASDVQIQPVSPVGMHYPEPQPDPRRMQDYQTQPTQFIPPVAEQPVRPVRMPTIDELPRPAQDQLRAAARAPQPEAAQNDPRRRTLLERLATFGLSRAEEVQQQAAVRQPGPVAMPQPPVAASHPHLAPAPAPAAPSPLHAEYGKRPAAPQAARPVGLDSHGRIASPARTAEEEQLEIPAFLRRQSN
jgi:cell division protein FtsZ